MIKHEEVRETLLELVLLCCMDDNEVNEYEQNSNNYNNDLEKYEKYLKTYITKQEKKDDRHAKELELLGLYRKLVKGKELSKRRKNNDVNRGWEGIYKIVIPIKEFNQIIALEEELK
jgi:hypothetical protein